MRAENRVLEGQHRVAGVTRIETGPLGEICHDPGPPLVLHRHHDHALLPEPAGTVAPCRRCAAVGCGRRRPNRYLDHRPEPDVDWRMREVAGPRVALLRARAVGEADGGEPAVHGIVLVRLHTPVSEPRHVTLKSRSRGRGLHRLCGPVADLCPDDRGKDHRHQSQYANPPQVTSHRPTVGPIVPDGRPFGPGPVPRCAQTLPRRAPRARMISVPRTAWPRALRWMPSVLHTDSSRPVGWVCMST